MLLGSILIAILVILIIVLLIIFLRYRNRKDASWERLLEREKIIEKQMVDIKEEQDQLEQYKKEIRDHIIKWKDQKYGNNSESINNFQNNVLDDMQDESGTTYWEDPVCNEIFLRKLDECQEKKILVILEGFPEKGIPLFGKSITEMIGLFANLTDNAIEACMHLPEKERWIQFHSQQDERKLMFQIENSCNAAFHRAPDEKTWKSNKQEHGIGKEIIHEIVNRNKGWIVFEEREKSHRVELMLPLKHTG